MQSECKYKWYPYNSYKDMKYVMYYDSAFHFDVFHIY